MLLRRSGQSIIEYTMLAVIVTIAIIIGGPFLKNSVNGALKLHEDSVIDSFEEVILQGDAILNSAGTCSCGAYTDVGCNSSDCNPGERKGTRLCLPPNCDLEFSCTPDPTCCGAITYGNCGEYTAPCLQGVNSNYTDVPGTLTTCGFNQCKPGQQITSRTCASGTKYGCIPNSMCDPVCWKILPPNSDACKQTTYAPRSDLVNEISDRAQNADPLRLFGSFGIGPTNLSQVGASYDTSYAGEIAGPLAFQIFWHYLKGTTGDLINPPPECNSFASSARRCEAYCKNPGKQISTIPNGSLPVGPSINPPYPNNATDTCAVLTLSSATPTNDCWYEILPTYDQASCMTVLCFPQTISSPGLPVPQGTTISAVIPPMPIIRDIAASNLNSDNLNFSLSCLGTDGHSLGSSGTYNGKTSTITTPVPGPGVCNGPNQTVIPVPGSPFAGSYRNACFTSLNNFDDDNGAIDAPPPPGADCSAWATTTAGAVLAVSRGTTPTPTNPLELNAAPISYNLSYTRCVPAVRRAEFYGIGNVFTDWQITNEPGLATGGLPLLPSLSTSYTTKMNGPEAGQNMYLATLVDSPIYDPINHLADTLAIFDGIYLIVTIQSSAIQYNVGTAAAPDMQYVSGINIRDPQTERCLWVTTASANTAGITVHNHSMRPFSGAVDNECWNWWTGAGTNTVILRFETNP